MEKLKDIHQIKLSKEKVRQIMIELGLWRGQNHGKDLKIIAVGEKERTIMEKCNNLMAVTLIGWSKEN